MCDPSVERHPRTQLKSRLAALLPPREGFHFAQMAWSGAASGEWTVKHSNLTLTGQKSTLNLSVTTASAGVTSFLYDGDLHRIFAFAIIDRRVIH